MDYGCGEHLQTERLAILRPDRSDLCPVQVQHDPALRVLQRPGPKAAAAGGNCVNDLTRMTVRAVGGTGQRERESELCDTVGRTGKQNRPNHLGVRCDAVHARNYGRRVGGGRGEPTGPFVV